MSDSDLDTPVVLTQRTLNEIAEKYAYLEALIGELRTENDSQEQKIHSLQSTVLEYGNRIKELETKSAASKSPEPKMPDPPMFSGERKDILPFLAKCRLKFACQPSMFPNEQTKVMYAGFRLEGPPFAWFTPLNERFNKAEGPIPTELTTFENFAAALTTLYGDPHLGLTAEREIRALRHTTSVAEYSARFEEHRQYLRWNDEALRDQFYLGLKDRIKDSIAPLGRPETLPALKDLALRLDARLDARWQEKQVSKITTPAQSRTPWVNRPQSVPQSSRPAPSTSVNPPVVPTNTVPSAPPAAKMNIPSHTADGTVPMELGSRGWQLTAAEKQRRRENNLCNYCANPGHRAFQCPQAPSKSNPRFQRQAFMNIDISDPPTIGSPSSMSVISQDTPSENSYTRE